jgi:hypothetical protein
MPLVTVDNQPRPERVLVTSGTLLVDAEFVFVADEPGVGGSWQWASGDNIGLLQYVIAPAGVSQWFFQVSLGGGPVSALDSVAHASPPGLDWGAMSWLDTGDWITAGGTTTPTFTPVADPPEPPLPPIVTPSELLPRPGDSEYNLLAKYLRKRGGTPLPGDLEFDLWRKLLRLVSPHARTHGTSVPKLAQEFLDALGGDSRLGDTYSLTLRRIVKQQGLLSTPSDNSWASLAKLLLADLIPAEDTPPEGFAFLLDGDGTPILDGNGVPFVVLLGS